MARNGFCFADSAGALYHLFSGMSCHTRSTAHFQIENGARIEWRSSTTVSGNETGHGDNHCSNQQGHTAHTTDFDTCAQGILVHGYVALLFFFFEGAR